MRMKLSGAFVLAFLCVLGVPPVAVAQTSPSQVPGLNAAMTRLFGDNNAFTAIATASILDDKRKETMAMPMSYAVLDGKIRSEVDMTKVKSPDLPAGSSDNLKQMGMDRMISIVRPDKQAVIVVYPTLRAYAESPLNKSGQNDSPQDFKINTEKLGSETVAGHPCQKNKVTISGKDGQKHEAIVWNATDLKNFPVKMEMPQPGGTTVMTYTDVKFEKPDAKLFEPPAGFEKYESVEKLLQSAMMKMFAK